MPTQKHTLAKIPSSGINTNKRPASDAENRYAIPAKRQYSNDVNSDPLQLSKQDRKLDSATSLQLDLLKNAVQIEQAQNQTPLNGISCDEIITIDD